MKKIFITFLVAMLSVAGYCQSDFEVAQTFMNKKGVKLSTKAETRSPGAYSLFSGEGGVGYAAVQDGRVVAYSTKESSDKFTLMCSRTRSFELTPKYEINPMIDCSFSQVRTPFNDMTPIVNGRHCPVGCGPIAVAKIMFYYKNPGCEAIPAYDYGSGGAYLEALPETTFNWDLIRGYYNYGMDYTDEEAEEVAKLMKYAGYAFEARYNYGSTGCWLRLKYFKRLGFSSDTYSTLSDYWNGLMGSWTWFDAFDEWKLSDKELEATIDVALEKRRPVLLAGYNREATGGHWYVIDGRDDTGMYHIQNSGYYIVSQEMYMNDARDDRVLSLLNKVWVVVPVMPNGWTSIESTKADNPNDDIVYSLSGRKVGNTLDGLPKGVYIKGGKKFIVK